MLDMTLQVHSQSNFLNCVQQKPPFKAYLALFVCLVVKVVHVELVSDLTTEACIATLKRFISRRGLQNCIYGDNARNFQGARSLLLDIQKHMNKKDAMKEIQNSLTPLKLEWITTPPPHFGRLWAAGIKSAKSDLKHIVGNCCLMFEELSTVITQTEAVLNSRTFCPLTDEIDDNKALTPGHFLIDATLSSENEALRKKSFF